MISDARTKEILERLPQLVVEISTDPEMFGKRALVEKIGRIQGYQNEVAAIYQDIYAEQYEVQTDLSRLEAAFAIQADELLANDARVSPDRLPSIDERKAMVNIILMPQRKEIQVLQNRLKAVSILEKAVRHRQRELDRTQRAIKLQKELIENADLSGRYGGGNNPRKGTIQAAEGGIPEADLSAALDQAFGSSTVDSPVPDALQDILPVLDETEAELPVLEPSVPAATEELELTGPTRDEAMLHFLASPNDQEIDVDSIFSSSN